MSHDAELDTLLASAQDTHSLDFVKIQLFDQETGEKSKQLNIKVRGANLYELALFFKNYPPVFKLFVGANKSDSDVSVQDMFDLITSLPGAVAELNSVFVSQPFKKDVKESFAEMSDDVTFPLLEKGIFKTFGGDVKGFFDRRKKGLQKAMGLKDKEISAQT